MHKQQLLLFFDYEGTLATSRERHYVQYVETLLSLQGRLNLKEESILTPVDRTEFLRRYPSIKTFSELLPYKNADSAEANIVRALVDQTYLEILWQYRSDHLALEEVLPGTLEVITHLCQIAACVIVSYTRQSQAAFVMHLKQNGLVAPGRFSSADVFTVGSNELSSTEAKLKLFHERFGTAIRLQRHAGALPVYVGDSVSDIDAALNTGLGFIGVTETGRSRRADFEKALKNKAQLSPEIPVALFPSLADRHCIEYIESHLDRCNAKLAQRQAIDRRSPSSLSSSFN